MPYNKNDPNRKQKQREAQKRYREKNKNNPAYRRRVLAAHKTYREKAKHDPVRRKNMNAHKIEWKERNTDKVKKNVWRYDLKRKYGITEQEYNTLLSEQNNLCAICESKDEDRKLAVDHDHTTGKIRGLLCRACNTGIGLMKENLGLLEKAIRYLS